ncbi:MAG: BatA domain-containing protein [Phycisphaerales bacterium]|nr:BatA domain-containing protein [Phycisphaerales bacterium]
MLDHLNILAFGFLAPWLFAAGAAATSIPIIIHLLNKRKFRIIVWAAMEFLLAAQRRNARRLRFRRWLLLAVRCLALLVLAAAVGQMVLDNTAIGSLFGGQRAIIVILDDSYSMAYQRPGTASAFERSRKLLKDWLGKLSSSDKVMLIRASRGGVQAGNRATSDHAGLESQIKAMEVSDAGTDLAAALDQAAETLKEMERTVPTRDVMLLTDFSNSSIQDPPKGIEQTQRARNLEGERLKKAVETVKAHATQFRVFDLGTDDQMNIAVTDLRTERPVVIAGQPSIFNVTVMNAKQDSEIDVPLTIFLDGVAVQTEKLPKLEVGSPRTVPVKVIVPTPGRHLIEARIPDEMDFLPIDNVRHLMIDARREIPILLVEGDPGDGGRTSWGSTSYVRTALPSAAQLGVFSRKTITDLELPTVPLEPFSVVILTDSPAPRSAALRENLRKYVDKGGVLMIFPGANTNVREMNDLLGDAGIQLLPATLGQPMDMGTGVGFDIAGSNHPVIDKLKRHFEGGEDPGFKSVQTMRYLKLGVPLDGSAEVILNYANGGRGGETKNDAAVVMRRVEKGKVVLFASSADTSWNTWGGKPSFLPFMVELVYHTISADGGGLTLSVGDQINLPGEVENPGAWTGPRGIRFSVNSALDQDGRPRLTSMGLPAAGVYGPEGRAVVAVNPDAEEVDIRHVSAAQMAGAMGIQSDEIVTPLAPGSAGGSAWLVAADSKNTGGSELARNLLLAAFALFLVETLLARIFSVYR